MSNNDEKKFRKLDLAHIAGISFFWILMVLVAFGYGHGFGWESGYEDGYSEGKSDTIVRYRSEFKKQINMMNENFNKIILFNNLNPDSLVLEYKNSIQK